MLLLAKCVQVLHLPPAPSLPVGLHHPNIFALGLTPGAVKRRFHTAAVTIDGSVWTYGRGSYAVLGHADRLDQLVPRRVAAESLPRTIVMVAAACRHTLALSAEGQVFSWVSKTNPTTGVASFTIC